MSETYRLVRHMGSRCLLCLRCNRISFNPNDVQQRYCGHCHVFLEDGYDHDTQEDSADGA